jgi:hypothetical protein
VSPIGGFEEEHSHATSHLLLPEDPEQFARPDGAMVLVDDELSTGRTALNTIAALHATNPRPWYVIAALVDVRSPADRARVQEAARQLGARIDVVSLAAGEIELPENVLDLGAELVSRTLAQYVAEPEPDQVPAVGRQPRRIRPDRWRQGIKDGGRHGFTLADQDLLAAAVRSAAAEVIEQLRGDNVLVLGFEELMYAPLRLGVELAQRLGSAASVKYSTTTRSPVVAVDDPSYAIRTRLVFPSHDDPADGPGERYAYNVAPGQWGTRCTDIVLMIDDVADTPELHAPGGLVDQLQGCCDQLLLIIVPAYRIQLETRPVEPLAVAPAPTAGTGWPEFRLDDLRDPAGLGR